MPEDSPGSPDSRFPAAASLFTLPFPLPSRYWADLPTTFFADAKSSGAAGQLLPVLPVAATEQHGPHLPLGVDTFLLEAFIQAALPNLAEDWPILFLPTQAIGRSIEHTAFAGTLSLSFNALLSSWLDIGHSLFQAGVQRLVVLNSHGGNASSIDIVARELRAKLNMQVWCVNTLDFPLSPALQTKIDADEQRFGIHGGLVETSLMLAIRPECVNMEKAAHFYHSRQRVSKGPWAAAQNGVKLAWAMEDVHPMGAAGNALAATPELGQALLENMGQHLAKTLGAICACRV